MTSPRGAVPLVVYRVADGRHPLLDGSGAARYGGRWHSPGRQVVYTARSYAGALLETLVHANIGRVPVHHVAIALTIPADVAIETVGGIAAVGWDAPDLVVSREIGDRWLASGASVALAVPSAVALPHEQNVLLNPAHPEFIRISASRPEAVRWDARLFDRERLERSTALSPGQSPKKVR